MNMTPYYVFSLISGSEAEGLKCYRKWLDFDETIALVGKRAGSQHGDARYVRRLHESYIALDSAAICAQPRLSGGHAKKSPAPAMSRCRQEPCNHRTGSNDPIAKYGHLFCMVIVWNGTAGVAL